MPTGFGGLLSNLMMGDPGAVLARRMSLTDPNPGQQTLPSGATQPAAGGNQPPPGMMPPGPGQTAAGGLPSPQVYAPDPTNSANIAALTQPGLGQSTGELMMKMHQQDMLSADLNRNITRMGASFGTAGQQALGMQAANATPTDDRIAVLGDIMKAQAAKSAIDEHNRFMAGAAGLAKFIAPGISDANAVALANSPILPQMVQTHFEQLGPTDMKKNFDTAQAAVRAQIKSASPDLPDAEVERQVNAQVPPSLLLSGVGTLADQEYRQYAAAERAAGNTPMGPVDWAEQKKNQAIIAETQSKDSQAFKDNAIQDFSAVDQKLNISEKMVDDLLANIPATMAALRMPDILTTSKLAANLPGGIGLPDEATKQAAVTMQKLKAQLTGEGLTNVKNVRNVNEFNTLGQSMTAALNANNGDDGVKQALLDLKQRFSTAHANAYATAGKQIPAQYAGMADPRYTSKTIDGRPNPYFTGAAYELSTDAPTGVPPASGAPVRHRRYNSAGELVD